MIKPNEYTKEIKIANKPVLGYKIFYDPNHPLSNKCGWVYYHRHVVSLRLNRWINSDEQVHHINEIKLDNDVENLELLNRSEHAHRHNGFKKKHNCLICRKESDNDKYCSQKCAHIGQEKLSITSDELHEVVWSGPLMHISQELGLSDVALKKRCNKLKVSVPPVGYWLSRNSGKSHEAALKQLKINKLPKLPPRFTKEQLDLVFLELNNGDLSLRKIGKLINCCHQSVMRFQKAFNENKQSEIYLKYKIKSC